MFLQPMSMFQVGTDKTKDHNFILGETGVGKRKWINDMNRKWMNDMNRIPTGISRKKVVVIVDNF